MISRGRSIIDVRQPVNLQHPLNRGLVSWWKVIPQWRGGATWRDLMRVNGAHDGTLTSMDPATDWVGAGRPGGFGALNFDGSSHYVETTKGQVDYPFTLTGWVKPTSTSVSHTVIGMGDSSKGDEYDIVILQSDGTVAAVTRVGGNNTSATTDTYTTGWNFVTGVFASATSRLIYLNGEPGTENTDSADPQGVDMTRIGVTPDSTPSAFTNGFIDDVRRYNRALSAAEVRALYYASQERFSPLLRFRRSVGFVAAVAPAETNFLPLLGVG